MVFKTYYCLMQVKSIAECSKWIILQYFRPSLSYQLSSRPLFCLFFEWPLMTGFTVWLFIYNMYPERWTIFWFPWRFVRQTNWCTDWQIDRYSWEGLKVLNVSIFSSITNNCTTSIGVNQFKPNEISHSYQLDQPIYIWRVVGLYFSFLWKL